MTHEKPRKHKKAFKIPPKRFQPKGVPIVYEDNEILVVIKRGGLLTISNDRTRDKTAYFILSDYVKRGNSKSNNRIFIVHRLDKDTSGLIVFAKTEEAKRFLQDEWQTFSKNYYTVIHGKMPEEEGLITSYLAENAIHKMFSTDKPKNGKLAKTGYKVLKTNGNYSLLEIDLLTGRKNQIRVHMSDSNCPIAGDKIYGPKERAVNRLCLHAGSLSFKHPLTKKDMSFKAPMPDYFRSLVK